MFADMMLAALLAVSAENLFFVGGLGFSRVLRAARRPGTIGLYALFITLFSLMSVSAGMWLDPYLPDGLDGFPLRIAVYALSTAVAYLLVTYLIHSFLPSFYEKYSQYPAPAAINTVVLAMPYLLRRFHMDAASAIGFSLGTGVSFFLASVLMAHAMERCKNKDMPRAFSGLPAALLYVGILSMAFAGFTGGRIF